MATFTLVGQTVSGDPLLSGGNINITTSVTSELIFADVDDVLGDPLAGETVSVDGGLTQLSYALLGYGFVRGDPFQYAAFIRIDNGDGTFDTVAIDMNEDGDRQPTLTNGNTKLTVADLTTGNLEPFPPPPCFTPGTQIVTRAGIRAVRQLRVGVRVLTRDNGYQPIRWIGARHLTREDLSAAPELAPVVLRKNALGGSGPVRPLVVSPQHRLLIRSSELEMVAGTSEALIPACQLTRVPGVFQRMDAPVTYMHLLFDQHEVILSNGVWTESFQPSVAMVGGFGDGARAEVTALFPELGSGRGHDTAFESARATLNWYELAGMGLERAGAALAA